MIRLREAIVVEGRYDQNKLAQMTDTLIVPTEGFGIFKNAEKLEMIRQLARTRGIIILTDSDGAGFVIRNYLRGAVTEGIIRHAYIPDRYGKEKRKKTPGKEGKLGVEGMPPSVLEQALRQAGATIENGQEETAREKFTKTDLFMWGLSGGAGSRGKREYLLRKLDLPEHLSPNAMLPVLSSLATRGQIESILEQMDENMNIEKQ